MPTSVVFVDTRVADYQSLLEGMDPGVEIVLLDPALDGVMQMAQWLAGKSGYDALHVISHGGTGRLDLGTTSLTLDTLGGYADALATLGSALTAEGDLLLYGCNVAAGETGQAFVQQLSALTGADVAASATPTGAAELGGDWVLETGTGSIEAAALTATGYGGLLAVDNTAPSFLAGTGMTTTDFGGSDTGRSVAVQADGKILVGGESGGNFALARYNSDGSLDTSFGTGGKLTDLGGYGYSVAVQSDGKILLGGGYGNFALARYNANGSLDTTFDGDGKLTTDFGSTARGYSVAVQSDGKILLGGESNSNFALARYNVDGTLDTSFGSGGVAITDIGEYFQYGGAIAVQSDGKILQCGTNSHAAWDIGEFALVRYDTNGNLDTSFGGGDGMVSTPLGGGWGAEYAESVTVQADGKILVGGYSGGNFALVRYNSNGDLDTTFSNDGMLTTDFGSTDRGYSVTVQADGKILLGGYSNGNFALVRYNADGSLDSTFDGDGKLTTDFGGNEYGYSVTVDADGKILLGGTSGGDFALARYNSDGSLDTHFGPVTTLDGAPAYIQGGAAVVLDSNVQITDAELAAGGNYAGATLTLVRDGGANADDRFSGAGISAGAASGDVVVSSTTIGSYTWSGGQLVISFNASATQTLVNQALQSLAYSNANSDLAAGTATINWSFSDGNSGSQGAGGALTASGSTTVTLTPSNDAPSFNGAGDGKLSTDFGDYDTGYSVAVQADGKILLGGTTNNGTDNDFALARYNADGTLDTGFSGDGKLTTDFGASYDTGYSVAMQSDGKILLAGNNGADFALARYNADGSLDTSFSGDGKVTADFGNFDKGYSAIVQADGKILVAGDTTDWGSLYDFALARYNADGTLDTGFGGGDGMVTSGLGGGDYARSITLQADGKILVAGFDDNGFMLVRYNADGTLDTGFDADGLAATSFGSGDQGNSVAVQADGKILVAGYSGSDFALARYNSDGSLDTTFSGDGMATADFGSFDAGYSVTVDANGKILVSGDAHNGTDSDLALARFNADGTLDTTFSGDGLLVTDLGANEYGKSVSVQADGSILAGGHTSDGTSDAFVLVRYNADGTLDTRFDPATSLDATPSYTLGGAAVVLDSNVQVTDPELAAGGNYAGATLTLARNGGANADDQFSGAGITAGAASGNVVVSSTTVGTYAWSVGQLVITFNASATETLVNQAMRSLAYSNAGTFPPASVQIDWSFSDGNTGAQGAGGALAASGSTTVSITSNNIQGTAGADTLNGTSAANVLGGLGGNDTLNGNGGNDTLNGGGGADTMKGGAGNDTYVVDNAGDVVTELSAQGTDLVQSGISYTLTANVEKLTLTGSSAINGTGNGMNNGLTGNSAANVLSGLDGADTLTGNGGADTLNGGAGADAMSGGLGNDTYVVDNAGDVVTELTGEGTDLVQSGISYTLTANVENLTLTGAAAINGTGNDLNNTLTGNSAANKLLGLVGADTLNGNDGSDTLNGGADADTMKGGAGNDTYVVDHAGDVVTELSAQGTDLVQSGISYTLTANVEKLTLTGASAINGSGNGMNNVLTGNSAANVLSGLDGADTLTGNGGNDVLNGGAGADAMSGNLGNDTYVVDNAGDSVTELSAQGTDLVQSGITYTLTANVEKLTLTGANAINGSGNGLNNVLTGNSAANTLSGLAGADTLNGNDGSDTLNGGADADTMKGGAGNDTLNGGLGNDVLTGGTGNDFFVFDTALGAGTNLDTIQDYSAAADTIRLENGIFTQLATTGVLGAANFKVGTAAADANDFIVYNSSTGALYYDADGSGAGAATQFATVYASGTTPASLSAGEFVVI
jgi:uncharacterized delta-60 repeat protein